MTPRRLLPLLALIAVVAGVLLVVITREDDRYAFELSLENALGLRTGSQVTIGGVKIGEVDVSLDKSDKVTVRAMLNDGYGPIGRDATVTVTSVNLIGQKRLEIAKGDTSKPLPDGGKLPAARLTPSTDLDQVLAVLRPTTRQQLTVLINEAGAGMAGRGNDLSRLIETLPPTLTAATEVVDRVTGDNRRIAAMVENSDAVIASVTRERKALASLVDSAGQAAESAATKRAEIAASLDRAPGLLQRLQIFLGDLERTTVPLGPAARDIAATAPEIERTLTEVRPFQKAARPTLTRLTTVAPSLTKLAKGATPTVRRAAPVLKQAAVLSSELVPVTQLLNKSIHNLIASLDNWSRAVQFRDGMSHIFRGELTITPQTVESLLNRYGRKLGEGIKPRKRGERTPGREPVRDTAPVSTPAPSAPAPQAKQPDPVRGTVESLTDKLDDTLAGRRPLLPGLGTGRESGGGASGARDLLDSLLAP